MSDLKKTATSMHKAASGPRGVGHHTTKPLREFMAQSYDLGALGSLPSATDETREGWEAEAKLVGEVSDAWDLLDVLVAAAAHNGEG